MLKWKKKLILVDVEDEYGVDKEPAGSDAVLAENVSVQPYTSETINRERAGRMGAYERLQVGVHSLIEFDVPISGSGTPATPAPLGKLLRACAMAETIVPAEPGPNPRCEYDPVDDGEESATIYFVLNGTQMHRMVGVRGRWGLRLSGNQRLMMHFAFVGLYAAPSVVSAIAANYSGWVNALPISTHNTTVSVRGFSPRVRELTIDQGGSTPFRDLVNVQEVGAVDREVAGSITIEAPSLSEKDYFAEVSSNNPFAGNSILSLQHGTAAGNIFEFSASRVQLSKPTYGEADGITTLQMDLVCVPTDAGGDDFQMTTR